MPRLTLLPEERAQLNDWLFGGPTDPVGLVNWLADPNNANEPANVIYQAEGERDVYQFLLAKDGSNVRRQDLTQKMIDAVTWVASSLDNLEALLGPEYVEAHQQRMRALWNWIKGL